MAAPETAPMTEGHVFIATSLDGFVARPDHALDWLTKQNTASEDHGYDAFMDSVDGIVMGAGSFHTVLGFDDWPYAKPVVVLSHTLTQADIPPHLADRVRISGAEPAPLLRDLAGLGWQRAYVDGGRVVQSFLRAGLISQITLTLIPILIGDGIRLFGPLEADRDLTLVRSRGYASGLLQAVYRVR